MPEGGAGWVRVRGRGGGADRADPGVQDHGRGQGRPPEPPQRAPGLPDHAPAPNPERWGPSVVSVGMGIGGLATERWATAGPDPRGPAGTIGGASECSGQGKGRAPDSVTAQRPIIAPSATATGHLWTRRTSHCTFTSQSGTVPPPPDLTREDARLRAESTKPPVHCPRI